jgi:hypothetical protein
MVLKLYATKSKHLPSQKASASQDEICYTELFIKDRNVLKSLQNITDIRAQQVENFTLILERYFGTYPKCATRIGYRHNGSSSKSVLKSQLIITACNLF